MSDIFISYAREDQETASQFAVALESQGFAVWWDRSIPAGRTFDDVIEKAIDETKCVVVLWSQHSADSKWVKKEASEGENREILIPVIIEKVKLPFRFRQFQNIDMVEWDGTTDHRSFAKLLADLNQLLKPSGALTAEKQDQNSPALNRTSSSHQGTQPAEQETPKVKREKTTRQIQDNNQTETKHKTKKLADLVIKQQEEQDSTKSWNNAHNDKTSPTFQHTNQTNKEPPAYHSNNNNAKYVSGATVILLMALTFGYIAYENNIVSYFSVITTQVIHNEPTQLIEAKNNQISGHAKETQTVKSRETQVELNPLTLALITNKKTEKTRPPQAVTKEKLARINNNRESKSNTKPATNEKNNGNLILANELVRVKQETSKNYRPDEIDEKSRLEIEKNKNENLRLKNKLANIEKNRIKNEKLAKTEAAARLEIKKKNKENLRLKNELARIEQVKINNERLAKAEEKTRLVIEKKHKENLRLKSKLASVEKQRIKNEKLAQAEAKARLEIEEKNLENQNLKSEMARMRQKEDEMQVASLLIAQKETLQREKELAHQVALKKKSFKEPEMITINGGTFLMGSPSQEQGRGKDEGSQHNVYIERFSLGRTEVTFHEYDLFAKDTNRKLPGDKNWGRGQRPVINVSWKDATAYAAWLSRKSGKRYRLPSEAEWEYAARAGTATPFSTGTCIHTEIANYNGKDFDYANCGSKTGFFRSKTVAVSRLPANPWGLHEMHGNVWEWTQDCWHKDYSRAPAAGRAWEHTENGKCGLRVIRGGGWFDNADSLRSADRNWINSDEAFNLVGFRLARTL